VAGIIANEKFIVLTVILQVTSREDEVFPEVKFQDGLVNIAIGELMFFFVVVSKEFVNYFFVTDGTNRSKELIHIEGFELGFEEFRTKNILVAERTGTNVKSCISTHVGQAWFPKCNDAVLLYDFETDVLKSNRIGCLTL